MPFKLGSMFLVVRTGIVALAGCGVDRDMMVDMLSATVPGMTDAMDMMASADTESPTRRR